MAKEKSKKAKSEKAKDKSKDKDKKKKKKKRYAVFHDEYKGTPTLGIFEVDKEGEKVRDYPLIAFGREKAKVLTNFADEIKAFAKGEEE